MTNADIGTADSSNLPVVVTTTSANVLAVDFDLVYNSNDLNITNVLPGSGLPSGWSVTFNSLTAGVLHVSVSGTTALPVGQTTLIDIVANVPTTAEALYGEVRLVATEQRSYSTKD